MISFDSDSLKDVVKEIAVDNDRKNESAEMRTAVVALRLKKGHALQGHIPVKVKIGDDLKEMTYALRKGQDSVILISTYPKDVEYLIFKIGQIDEGDTGISVSDFKKK